MMLRAAFERELQKLRDEILALGSEVENNIIEGVKVLTERDVLGAQKLIAGDQEVNRKRIAIMNDALVLIATQQPMAGDMRLIASVIEIAGELERINDYVKGIARISLMMGPEPIPNALDGLPLMADITRRMLHDALSAANRRDAELARAIPVQDDEIDSLFNDIYRQLIEYVANDPDLIERANHLEWAAHNLERAADRVTNICEWVVYMTTGKYVEMDSELEAPPS
jgi:phosphate transport system protein